MRKSITYAVAQFREDPKEFLEMVAADIYKFLGTDVRTGTFDITCTDSRPEPDITVRADGSVDPPEAADFLAGVAQVRK